VKNNITKRGVYIYNSLARDYFLLVAICMQIVNLNYNNKTLFVAILLIIFVISIYFKKIGIIKILGIIIICIIVVIVNYQKFYNSKQHLQDFLNEEYKIVGEVSHYPFVKNNSKVFNIKPKYLQKSNGQIIKIDQGTLQIKTFKYSTFKKGDVISFTGFIEEPENFDEFDYKEYLKVYDIYGLVPRPYDMQLLRNNNSKFTNIIANIRIFFIKRIRTNYPEPHASLLLGMLIGTRESFSAEFNEYLKNTGTTHIIAVSGFNVTIVVANTLLLAGALPKKYVVYLAGVMLMSFSLLVGIDNLPAMRAVIMGAVSLLGIVSGRKSNISALLSITFIGFILVNPLIYKSLSFQLSFASTVGLVVVSPIILEKLERIEKLNEIKEEFATSLSAILITFPITFTTFGGVSFISIVANIFLAGLISPIMLFGFLGTIGAYLGKYISFVFNMITWALLDLMVKIISMLGQLKYSYVVFDQHLKLISIVWLVIMGILVFENKYKSSLSI